MADPGAHTGGAAKLAAIADLPRAMAGSLAALGGVTEGVDGTEQRLRIRLRGHPDATWVKRWSHPSDARWTPYHPSGGVRHPGRPLRPAVDHSSEGGVVAPLLDVNPGSDREFRDLAVASLERADDDPACLERLLRQRYPQVIVRPRPTASQAMVIWQVYRDGFWQPE